MRSRRTLLQHAALGLGAGLTVAPLHAADLMLTPRQSMGPFYPRELPLDADNDLVSVAGRDGLAMGDITNVLGTLRDPDGNPIAGAGIEIWQCDAYGRYHHPQDRRAVPLDPNFQGYGRTITDNAGRYRFRTIKPVAYPGRAPHIHYAVKAPSGTRLITQLYVAGEPGNNRDGLLRGIRDPGKRDLLIRPFVPDPDRAGQLLAHFDIVISVT